MPQPKDPTDNDRPAGRVRHDSSGRAVWEWAAATGRHAIDSTSRLLKRLELPGLSLEDEDKEKSNREKRQSAEKPSVPTFGGKPEADPQAGSKRNFNPYDNRTPPKKVTRSVVANRPAAGSPVTSNVKKKPGLFARLFSRRPL
jgi:hypothetical protein